MLNTIEKLPTYGQLERDLSQMIYQLYREEFDHSPSKISCKFFSNNLAIVIEDSLTTIEKSLLKANKANVVRNLNLAINSIVKSKLKILVEQKLGVEVYNILFYFSLRTPDTGVIFILSQPPLVRHRKAITKNQKNKRKNEYVDKSNFPQTDKNLNLALNILYLVCLQPDKDTQPDIYLWKIMSNLTSSKL